LIKPPTYSCSTTINHIRTTRRTQKQTSRRSNSRRHHYDYHDALKLECCWMT
jgi:hypothetical protein